MGLNQISKRPVRVMLITLSALTALAVIWISDTPIRITAAEQERTERNRQKQVRLLAQNQAPKPARNLGPGLDEAAQKSAQPGPRLTQPQAEDPEPKHFKATPRPPLPTGPKKNVRAADDLFTNSYVPTLSIEIPDAGVDKLSSDGARRYVRATVREGELVYTNVAIRLKGGPGSYRQFGDKPAFTLNFTKYNELDYKKATGKEKADDDEFQRFHGLKKIHLNNSVQDGTYLSEKICRELFNAAGVPTPRAAHAWVEVNGRSMGLYVLIEGANKQFLKRHFKNPDGHLFDGHSGSEVNRNMEVNDGDPNLAQAGLSALNKAARLGDLDARMTALEKTLDVDRFLTFAAMEVMTAHWDGYLLNRNNFRIFHDLEANRMVFIPQGMDQTFRNTDAPILPDVKGYVARQVLEIPEARRRYLERASYLLTNVFRPEVIARRSREIGAYVSAAIAEHRPNAGANFQQRANQFARAVSRRVQNLETQLKPEGPLEKFTPSGELHVTNWQPQIDAGEAQREIIKDAEGKKLLRLAAGPDGCRASYRSRLWLQGGPYRLEGKVKTSGVVIEPEDTRGGVTLRIANRKVPQKLVGDNDWQDIAFDFTVPGASGQVDLVCELRAQSGEALFQLDSLRLVRR